MGELQVPAPVCSKYRVSSSAQLVIKRDRKSWGRDKFTVRNSSGELLFEVTSKLLSVHLNGLLQDQSGKTIVFMKAKFFTWDHRWEAYRGDKESDNNFLFTLKTIKRSESTVQYEVFLAKNRSRTSDFVVKGNFLQKNFTILYGDRLIAKTRGSGKNPSSTKEGCYGVTVEPDVDQAFMAALVFILDENRLYDLGAINGLNGDLGGGGGAGNGRR